MHSYLLATSSTCTRNHLMMGVADDRVMGILQRYYLEHFHFNNDLCEADGESENLVWIEGSFFISTRYKMQVQSGLGFEFGFRIGEQETEVQPALYPARNLGQTVKLCRVSTIDVKRSMVDQKGTVEGARKEQSVEQLQSSRNTNDQHTHKYHTIHTTTAVRV